MILSARRVEELERVKNQTGKPDWVHIVPLDLSQTEAVAELAAAAHQHWGRIDILINNGGISQRETVDKTQLMVDRRIMEVNYFGQIALTKAVLPYMLSQGAGHIAAISSLTGKFGFPLRSAYAASKHALHGFFESLYLELKDQGIGVTLVNPGRIRTHISLHALTGDGKEHQQMDPGQDKGMTAEVCARKILRAIARQKVEVNIGGTEILMIYFKRYVPWLFRWIAGRVEAK